MTKTGQLITRILQGTIISVLLFLLVRFFLWKYSPESNTIEWFIEHKIYTVYIFASIIILYSLWSRIKKSTNFLFNLIVVSHFVIGGFYFTQENFKLSSYYNIIFLSLVVLLFLVWKIKYKIKWLFLAILFLWALWIMSFAIFPLFEEKPDIDWFIKTQKNQIIPFISEKKDQTSFLILIENNGSKKSYDVSKLKNNIELNLQQKNIISFASQHQTMNNGIFINLRQGDNIFLPTQSSMSLEVEDFWSWQRYKTEILQGWAWFFRDSLLIDKTSHQVVFDNFEINTNSGVFVKTWQSLLLTLEKWKISSGDLVLVSTWWNYVLGKDTIKHNSGSLFNDIKVIEFWKKLNIEFRKNMEYFLTKQIDNFIISSKLSRKLNKLFLDILFTVDSEKFGNNLINYKEFEQYIPELENKKFYDRN